MSAEQRNGFPWPSYGQLADAAQCIRDEYARRECHRQQISLDLFGRRDVPITSVKPPTPEDLVNIVLWSLRGQREPDADAPILSDGFPGGFPSDRYVEALYDQAARDEETCS